jgi:hypothetical protein
MIAYSESRPMSWNIWRPSSIGRFRKLFEWIRSRIFAAASRNDSRRILQWYRGQLLRHWWWSLCPAPSSLSTRFFFSLPLVDLSVKCGTIFALATTLVIIHLGNGPKFLYSL